MRQTRKMALILALVFCLVPVLLSTVAFANGTPGLSEIIGGEQTQQGTTQSGTQGTDDSSNNGNNNNNSTTSNPSTPYDGGMVNTGGLTGDDLKGYSQGANSQNPEAQTAVNSALAQIMGWIVPILVGLIFAALTVRILLDLLYLVAPFLRHRLAPGVQGDNMGENQMGGGMAGGMGMGGMAGGMGMNGMGMNGGGMGMGGRGMGGRGMGGRGMGMQGNQMQQATGGTQWVSESAIAAVMGGNQVGPNGKPQNIFTTYAKSMLIPLVLVPIMLILLLSGVLTNVGFYFGDLLSSAIQSKVN